MKNATVPKNTSIIFNFITLLSITASGKLNAAVAIMNASAVPTGTPLSNNATAIGTIAAQLPYIGTPNNTAIGIANIPPLLIIDCINSAGM